MLVWSLRALDKVAPDNTDTPSTANTQAGADTTLPKTEKRKPAFSFYEELPKSEENVSDVDAYKQLAAEAPKYRYSLRTGAFKHAEQADKLRAELILMGFAPTIDQRISESGTTWHRVTLGPFPSRSKMYEARGKLLSKNLPAQILKEKAD
ncbi:hypothetical protein GYB62_01455 [bacterium]|nr:hypothetical protein [bacterium]